MLDVTLEEPALDWMVVRFGVESEVVARCTKAHAAFLADAMRSAGEEAVAVKAPAVAF